MKRVDSANLVGLVDSANSAEFVSLQSIVDFAPDSDRGWERFLYLFGVDDRGASVACQIMNWGPPIALRVPGSGDPRESGWRSKPREYWDLKADEFIKKINASIEQSYLAQKKRPPPPVAMTFDLELRIPFVGYTNYRRDIFLNLRFQSICDSNRVKKELQKNYPEWEIYHDDLPLSNAFLIDQGLQYQDWFKIKEAFWVSPEARVTRCTREAKLRIGQFERAPLKTSSPEILLCYLNVLPVSQEALTKSAPEWTPSARKPADRIIAVNINLRRITQDEPFCSVIFCNQSLWNAFEQRTEDWGGKYPYLCGPSLPGTTTVFVETERELLDRVKTFILDEWDPDTIVHYPSYSVHDLQYLSIRLGGVGGGGGGGLQSSWERWRRPEPHRVFSSSSSASASASASAAKIEYVQPLHTRLLLDVLNYINKKNILLTASHIMECVDNTDVYAKPHPIHFKRPSSLWLKSPSDWWKLLTYLKQVSWVLLHIELGMSFMLDAAMMSVYTHTPLNHVVNGGQSKQVENGLVVHGLAASVGNPEDPDYAVGYYFNWRDLHTKAPIKYSASTHPPTYPDPAEVSANVQFRLEQQRKLARSHTSVDEELQPVVACSEVEKARLRLAQKTKTLRVALASSQNKKARLETIRRHAVASANPDESASDVLDTAVEEEQKELEGGNVVSPSCGLYFDLVAIEDFNSLYPGIMIAYGICYSNVVLDSRYDPFSPECILPAVPSDLQLLNINKDEVILMVNGPGVIPRQLEALLKARKQAKKCMAEATTPFTKKRENFRQLSIKVGANSAYGWMGAMTSGKAIRELMRAVTGMGRYLQKTCSKMLYERPGGVMPTFGVRTLYGDTDSIFIQVPLVHRGQFMPSRVPDVEEEEEDSTEFPAKAQEILIESFKHYGLTASADYRDLVARHPTIRAWKHIFLAGVFEIFECLAKYCSDLFPHPKINLEFENASDVLWMLDKKKSYFGHVYSPKDPSLPKYYKLTGIPEVRRDWCPWLRNILVNIRLMITEQRMETDFITFFKAQLAMLPTISLEELYVSVAFKGEEAYTVDVSQSVQLAEKILKFEGRMVSTKERNYYLIAKGPEKLVYRYFPIEYFKGSLERVDLREYVRLAINPTTKMLTFHPDLSKAALHELNKALKRL